VRDRLRVSNSLWFFLSGLPIVISVAFSALDCQALRLNTQMGLTASCTHFASLFELANFVPLDKFALNDARELFLVECNQYPMKRLLCG